MKKYTKGLLLGVGAALVFLGLLVGLRGTLNKTMASLVGSPALHREDRRVDDLTYRTLDGKVFQVSALKGRVAFVNIWGSWCAPCTTEMPTVQKLYTRYKGDPDVVFVIAATQDTPESVREYVRRTHMALPFYITHEGDIPASLNLAGYPTTLIYAKDGSLAAQHAGMADWSTPAVVAFLHKLEAEPFAPGRTIPAAAAPSHALAQLR